jgi:hypothetical protein
MQAILEQYAEDNYGKGFDIFVECYADEEWAEFIAEFKTLAACKKQMRAIVKLRNAMANEYTCFDI